MNPSHLYLLPFALACSALCAVSEANARERSLRVERAWGSGSSAPLLLLQKELAAERQCHCRHCRQPGHLPLTNWQQQPSSRVSLSLPLALACSALCAVSEANAREQGLRVT
ncbi:MAG: hypothetical protein J0L63_04805 [Anaerolineae bacterium]|nr:hypothetical protein [Anaerolineae bacterium]